MIDPAPPVTSPGIYVDHAATSTIRPEALDAMGEALRVANGNASGTHASARAAKNLLEEARERAAVVLGADRPGEIVFTSGGTESDNMAVAGVALADGRRHVVVSAIEHQAVLSAARALERFGVDTAIAPSDADGVVTPDGVLSVCTPETSLVSVMAANNEIGTVQPVRTIADAARSVAPQVVVHTDAVQAFVGGDVDVRAMDVDLLTLAAHKFGGPKGVGLLYVRSGTTLEPIMYGGGQEAGRRPGTSNVVGIAGMVAAMDAVTRSRAEFDDVVGTERDGFERRLVQRIPTVVVNGTKADRMPHFSHVRFPGVSAETLLIRLDHAGVHAAAGSACQSGAVEPSHVLTAMGMTPGEAAQCVRFTFGWDTRRGDGARTAEAVADVVVAL